jgi:hypothetical protein
MYLSTRHSWILVGALVGCGSGGQGTVDVPGGPSGSFAVNGSPGPSQASAGLFSGAGSAGIFSGQGSPGVFATPDTDCAAICARIAALQCTPSQASDTPRDTSGGEPCAQACTEGRASLTSDCERNLYSAFLTCLLASTLTCRNGAIQLPANCPEPTSSQCASGQSTTTTTTTGGPPPQVGRDAG